MCRAHGNLWLVVRVTGTMAKMRLLLAQRPLHGEQPV
jgi:hypothetical protein